MKRERREPARPLAAVAQGAAVHLHYADPAEVDRQYIGRRRSAKTLCGQDFDAVRFVKPSARRVCNACASAASSRNAIVRGPAQSAALERSTIGARLAARKAERDAEREKRKSQRRAAKPSRARGAGSG